MNIILGGGLAGLSAAHLLSKSSANITLFEEGETVGGLARTIEHNRFRFDLGGHRFITRNKRIMDFVSSILNDSYLTVPRKSSIYMFGKYFDYPLRPANAVFGLGLRTTLQILGDYIAATAMNGIAPKEIRSLEDWVVSRFGRKMFNLYFKGYSEKVWGIESSRISQEWVSQRIKGLSMWSALKNAFFKFSGGDIDTLADSFIYPETGIGEISDNLMRSLGNGNAVFSGARVEKVFHENFTVKYVKVRTASDTIEAEGGDFVSTIPLTELLGMLDPAPPEDILVSAKRLKFRDLIVAAVMLEKPAVSDLTWLYLPEKDVKIGRIHEPNNWSRAMSPAGFTSIVAEYFCNRDEPLWKERDETIAENTADLLEKLNFISKREVAGSKVVRVPYAYPILDVGYRESYDRVMRYLGCFSNLHLAGRGGTFRYLNMDSAIESGLIAAETILDRGPRVKEESLLPV
ncbi:MAG: FAD-dependent oxidoreductase [Nitrospinota bacterium]|nr:FAD-dependent oxidoreductase [Nitrospinota bacterium]